MRVTYDSQLEFGQVLISDIELDIKSRDDVPRVLLGLQALFCDTEARTKDPCHSGATPGPPGPTGPRPPRDGVVAHICAGRGQDGPQL